MKKKISILLVVLMIIANLVCMTSTVFAEEASTEEETITISYIKDSNTLNNSTSLDTTAYSGGKQTVKKGEKFTLPTTSNTTNATAEGFQLVWYTSDGRTYKAGEEVSFEEDTRLYRVAAKECYTAAELGTALTNDTKAAILMADIETTGAISFPDWSTAIIIMNGFDLNFKTNASGLIGAQRTQRHIYGEGTINITNPDGKVGAYYFLKATNHGYAGDNSRTVIGRDVTINAPNHYLTGDESGDIVNRYVWTRIYGTINCYGLFYRPASNNCGAYTEFYDTCNVTITGPRLVYDANGNGKFNYLGVDIAIYGGTFYLPAGAASEAFWSNDNVESITNYDGSKTYVNVGLTQLNKDNIKIYGGSFVTADGSMPAIANYVSNTYTGAWKTGGNGIITNSNSSTYEVPYLIRTGLKLVFTQYSETNLGTITVTDYVGSSLAGKTFKYTVKTLDDGSYDIIVYESRMDGETEIWDVVSDELAIKWGNGGTILVSYDKTREALELHGFEANNLTYQTVVPATCEHNFTGAPVDATCQEKAYADYNCSKCAYNVYFSWGEKTDHSYETTETIAPTASTLGSTTFTCSTCNETKTYATTQDPTSFEVTVTILNDDGTFETVTALASDVFEFTTIGGNGAYMYTLSGIKAFDSYSIRNIYGVVIPNGVLYVNISTQNYEKYDSVEYGLNVLETAEGSTITIQNIGNLSMLTTFKTGKGSNVIFEPSSTYYNPTGEKRSCSKLATVDFSAGDVTIKVMSSAFQDRPITSLKLGANSTYDFQYQSFRNIKITELVIPQTATLTLGSNSFYDADLTSLTFPSGTADNIKQWTIGSESFRNNPITKVTFGEYGTYSLGNNTFYSTKITAIVLAPNSTYTIGSGCFASTQVTIFDASAGNMTVTVNDGGLKNLTAITEFKLGENSSYTFNGKSVGTTSFTKLVIPKNSTVSFGDNWLDGNTTFKEIDASADNVTLKFNTRAFNGRSVFDTIKFGKNANITFSEDCFKGTALTGLALPENATITFNGYGLRGVAITAIEIKEGSTVTFASNAFKESNVASLKLASNSSYTFNNGSFNYATLFTELVFPANTTSVFNGWTFNTGTTITKIDLSADNTTADFKGESLKNAKTIKEILLNGDNSTYTATNQAFKNIATLTTLDLSGENYTYTINGSSTMADLPNLTTLTLGKNSTYTFGSWMVNGTTPLQKLDASADGITVTFGNESFREEGTLTELLLNGKNGSYTFNNLSFYKTPIKEIVLGEGSTYVFNSGSFGYVSELTKIDASASNVTATFGRDVFNGRSTVTYIAFGENSTYTIDYRAFYNCSPTNDVVFSNTSTFTIGQQAFYGNDFASITFEDNLMAQGQYVTFTGTEAFNMCDKATELYIGKNIAITNYPFKNLKSLEKLVIMSGVTHANDYEFENAGSADFITPLVVYNHSYDITFTKGMFNNCDGIVLYTVTDNIGTRTDVFTNCGDVKDSSGNLLYKAWTVYLGIPHPLVAGHISDPTCTETGVTGWICDEAYCNCDFKIVETTVVNKYENQHNIKDTTSVAESTTYEVTVAPALGHDYGVENPLMIGWIYVDSNYFANAQNKHNCTVCGSDYLGKEIENSALFTKKGTTLPEDVKNAIAHAIIVNLDAIEAYEEYLGDETAVKYGVVAGLASTSKNPVTSDGQANGKVIVKGFEDTNYSILQLKISGIKDSTQGLYCSAYAIIDGTVFYLHNGRVSETAVEVSLDEPEGVTPDDEVVENVMVEAIIESKETIYA